MFENGPEYVSVVGWCPGRRDPLRERRRGGGDQKGGNNKDLELGHRHLFVVVVTMTTMAGDSPALKNRVLNRTLHLFVYYEPDSVSRFTERLRSLRAFFRKMLYRPFGFPEQIMELGNQFRTIIGAKPGPA